MRSDAKMDAHPQSAQHDPAHAHASVHARCIPHLISKLSAGALSGWPVHLVISELGRGISKEYSVQKSRILKSRSNFLWENPFLELF